LRQVLHLRLNADAFINENSQEAAKEGIWQLGAFQISNFTQVFMDTSERGLEG